MRQQADTRAGWWQKHLNLQGVDDHCSTTTAARPPPRVSFARVSFARISFARMGVVDLPLCVGLKDFAWACNLGFTALCLITGGQSSVGTAVVCASNYCVASRSSSEGY